MSSTAQKRVFPPALFGFALVFLILHMNYGPPLKEESVSLLAGRWLLAALADSFFGVTGARFVSVLFGAGLSIIIYSIAKGLFSRKNGTLAALVFFFSGVSIYVSELATAEIQAAFFLGLSLLFIVPERRQSGPYLFIGAISLAVAALTKYTAALFVLPMFAWAVWRHGYLKSGLYFILPAFIALSVYGVLFLPPPLDSFKTAFFTSSSGALSRQLLASRMFHLIGIPCLISIFGLFHENFRPKVFFLLLASVLTGMFYILSGDVSMDKDCVFPLIFLAPAASVGIEQMASLFSANTPSVMVKWFFLAAMLIVICVFGMHEFRLLQTR
jgi:hypothetical protein